MSSIYGLWRKTARIDLDSSGLLLANALAIYGPDRAASHRDDQVILGANLHRFLPEDDFDQQPLSSVSGAHRLVADLRLDNRDELAGKLHISPQHAATCSDSMLLMLAWEKWGPECVDHIVGPFAFAVWTPATQQIFAARDHMGERPLFFHRCPDFFAFASMPKGLLALTGIDQGLNEEMLLEALVLAKQNPARSYFKAIERVPPGHFLRVTPQFAEMRGYWKPFASPAIRFKRNEEYTEAFLEIFDGAVKACLRGNGPVASQLSSGLDSSSVTASAARQLARKGQRLTSFTAVPRKEYQGTGAHGRQPNEGPGAQQVAALYSNLDHVLIDSSRQDLVGSVTQLSDAIGEPVRNAVNSIWISAILSASAASGLKILLAAPRGNLTMSHAGLESLGRMLRTGRWASLMRTAFLFRKHGMVSFRDSAARAATGLAPQWLHRRINSVDTFDLAYSPINPKLAEEHGLRERMIREFFANRHDLELERQHLFQIYEVDTFNAGYRAIHGVDVRDPCADKRVAEFCFSIPSEQYVVGGFPRSLVRRAMKDRLPQSTLTRTLRGQQGADWNLTMRDALAGLREQIALNEASLMAQRMLDLPRMQSLLDNWPPIGEESMNVTQGWSDALCRGFSFGYFIRRHEGHAQSCLSSARISI